MFWNISSFILGIISICVSIFCWRFVISDIKKYNKMVDNLYQIDIFKEGGFLEAIKKIDKIIELEKKEINFSSSSQNKLTKNDIITCLYNQRENIHQDKNI